MTSADAPLLIALAPLLVASAFFSGTETAMFGLMESDRARLRARGGIGARATLTLLANPRPLLVTVLLGNMTINVLIFVLLSVLTLHAEGAIEKTAFSLGGLLAVILLGEVAPKIAATGRRAAWCRVMAPVMLTIHRALHPVRRPVLALVIDPLSRLVRPGVKTDHLTIDELGVLLAQSAERGDIGEDEAALLEGVAAIGRFQARDVMTPRVDIRWLDPGAGAEEVRAFARETGIARALVCEGSIDNGIIGVVELADVLLGGSASVGGAMRVPVFVPESARLDQLLETMRSRRERLAVIVDEYGGVAGVATLRDVAGRILGAPPGDEGSMAEIVPIERGVWRAPGRLCVRDWVDALAALPEGGPTTLGGVVVARLNRFARVGDVVTVGNITLTVESTREGVVEWLRVALADERDDNAAGAPGAAR
jgi:CBS domain containing-hemolysin-like protein